jgi:predicted transcriptional regulator
MPTKYQQAANVIKRGGTTDEVVKELGVDRAHAHNLLHRARVRGLLPPVRLARDRGGPATYEYFYSKKATPRMGTISRILRDLSAQEVQRLVGELRATDDSLAALLARIVKEHLDAGSE